MIRESIIAGIISAIIGMCGTIGAAHMTKSKGHSFDSNLADPDPNGFTPAPAFIKANAKGCSIQIAMFLAISLVSYTVLSSYALTNDKEQATELAMIMTPLAPTFGAGIDRGNAGSASGTGGGAGQLDPERLATPVASPVGSPASSPGPALSPNADQN